MTRSDARVAAQAAYVARRLGAEGLVRAKAPAEIRRAVETELAAERERDRALDAEVERLLKANAAAIRASGADYAEMFRKARRMLAEKKGIPL